MGLETAEWFTLLVIINIVYIASLIFIIGGDLNEQETTQEV
jgi:hypothetical protein